jgi:hypothetical protein
MTTRNKADNTFMWEEIPDRTDARNHWHTETQDALRTAPGKSARIKQYASASSALTSASNIRKKWSSDFTVVTRGNCVYATYDDTLPNHELF